MFICLPVIFIHLPVITYIVTMVSEAHFTSLPGLFYALPAVNFTWCFFSSTFTDVMSLPWSSDVS